MSNPYERDETPEDAITFPCACGDERCIGHNDDPQNIRHGSAWYAADCQMGQTLEHIANGLERASRSDVGRDEFNERRR